jgi:PAS domain S-box-containing protein
MDLEKKLEELRKALKKAEEEKARIEADVASLRESEERYRLLYKEAPVGIFDYDSRLRITNCNDSFIDMLRSSREEMVGLDMELLKDKRVLPAIRKALAGQEDLYEGPYQARTIPEGIWISLHTAPMLDRDGTVKGGMGIVEDVTERRGAEESLRKSEEQYKLLFKGNPNPMWVYDRETLSFLAVNDAAVLHYGYTRDEFLSMSIKDIRPAEDAAVVEGVSRTIRGDYRKVGIWRHKKKDGAVIDVEIITHDIEFNGREARLVLAYDVTARVEAEQSLYESEGKLRAITDTALDAILLIDEEERVVYWNPSASRMLGYAPEEIMGRNLAAVIPERFRATHSAAFRRFVESGRGAQLARTYETFALRKDGMELPVELSISGIRLKGKWHAAGIIRDMSERKKLEAQLLHSQKMEAIGRLSGGVAHDFNNILSAIIGYGHILLMKMRNDDPLRDNVEHLLASADRAAHLTRSLLTFSRKQVLNPRPVDLNEIIRRVGSILTRIIGEDIELRTAFAQGPVMVNADSGQIEQVLMNLATNARDSMPRGGAFSLETGMLELDKAFVRAHGYGEPGRYATVSAADSGAGMDEETRRKIFEPFFTTKEMGKGTGLGLSIAYGIVKQHKGYINAYSEPGLGTTFRVYLPLLMTGHERSPLPGALSADPLTRGTETILVAEDDEALRKLTRVVLEEFGYTVIAAVNGEDAVRQFADGQDRIQAVILDMIMPKMSGKEAYEEIRKIKPGVKALFVSGYTADKIRLESMAEEGVELLMKPISPNVLVRKVRELLDR